jgi:hypothetical protein
MCEGKCAIDLRRGCCIEYTTPELAGQGMHTLACLHGWNKSTFQQEHCQCTRLVRPVHGVGCVLQEKVKRTSGLPLWLKQEHCQQTGDGLLLEHL